MMPNQKQIQQLQAKLMKVQEDLGKETVEASVGGVVTVTMTGHHEVRAIKIDPEAVDPEDVESLEDALVTAFNAALEKAVMRGFRQIEAFESVLVVANTV